MGCLELDGSQTLCTSPKLLELSRHDFTTILLREMKFSEQLGQEANSGQQWDSTMEMGVLFTMATWLLST